MKKVVPLSPADKEEEESMELQGEETVGDETEELLNESSSSDPAAKDKDPILLAVGDFGWYQFYICVVGFLMTIPHNWVSLR